jgi:hypothetical protein
MDIGDIMKSLDEKFITNLEAIVTKLILQLNTLYILISPFLHPRT